MGRLGCFRQVSLDKGLDGHGVVGRQTGTAVVGSLGHKKFRSPGWKALPQSPRVVEGEAPVLFPVNDQNRKCKIPGQATGTDLIQSKPVEEVHKEHHSGRKKDTEKQVIGAIKASQGLLRPRVTTFQK